MINWQLVQIDAFTVIRMTCTIGQLQMLAEYQQQDTPVSGDALARGKAGLV